MSKPMVVTLPFVLLLLDFWPLGRVQGSAPIVKSTSGKSKVQSPEAEEGWRRWSFGAFWPLVNEKVPFFLISAVSCVLTVWAQQSEAMSTLAQVPIEGRISNALVSYSLYLWKMVWPHPLAVLYPYRQWPVWQVIAAACVLVFISWAVWIQLRRRPYLAVGWFWYLGSMIPVIGFVQVGIHSMADRYMYLPSIGILIMVVFGFFELGGTTSTSSPKNLEKMGRDGTRPYLGMGLMIASAVLVALAIVTYHQLGVWKNSISLFSHTVAVTKNNLRAEYNLGVALQKAGQSEQAIDHYRKALAIHPTALDAQAKTQTQAHLNMAIIFAEREDWPAAANEFKAVLAADPDLVQALSGLAACLIGMGQYQEAVTECEAAIRLKSQDAAAWRWMGVALADSGKGEEALRALQEAVRLNPNGPAELNEMAWFWATYPDQAFRNGSGALALAQGACELTNWQEPRCLGTLDAAYAETGNFPEAINTARRVAELARAVGNSKLAAGAEQRAALYKQGKAWRQAEVKSVK